MVPAAPLKSLRRGEARYLECLGRALVVRRSEAADEVFPMSAPIAPLDQQVAFHWFAERSVPRLLVRSAVGGWVSQWRNDVRIWEDKAFMAPPMLCRDDGPVMRLRDWYRQFFPPSREA